MLQNGGELGLVESASCLFFLEELPCTAAAVSLVDRLKWMGIKLNRCSFAPYGDVRERY